MKASGVSPEVSNFTSSLVDLFIPLNLAKPNPLPIIKPLADLYKNTEKVSKYADYIKVASDGAKLFSNKRQL